MPVSLPSLCFGLCRFYELTGHYPSSITVVSYTLKRDRFFTLHREALRFPADRFSFIGTPVGGVESVAEQWAGLRGARRCENVWENRAVWDMPKEGGALLPRRLLLMACGFARTAVVDRVVCKLWPCLEYMSVGGERGAEESVEGACQLPRG